MKEHQKRDQAFKQWLRDQMYQNMQDQEVADRIVHYAWDNGHAAGYQEVMSIAEDLYLVFSGDCLYLDNYNPQ